MASAYQKQAGEEREISAYLWPGIGIWQGSSFRKSHAICYQCIEKYAFSFLAFPSLPDRLAGDMGMPRNRARILQEKPQGPARLISAKRPKPALCPRCGQPIRNKQIEKLCLFCGKRFMAKRWWQKYCNASCQWQAW